MKPQFIPLALCTLLLILRLSAQSKLPGDKIVLPTEPAAQIVTKKVDILKLFRDGKAETHINPKADIVDDPKNIFKFESDGLFHVSGNGYGGITTLDSFKDYHLVIEFKWGDKTFGKRSKATRDNGILVHCFGPQGAVGGSWMASIEAQIIEGGVGDILVLSPKLADGTVLEASISAEVGFDRDKEKVWSPGSPRMTMKGGRLNWQKRDVDWKDTIGFRGKNDVESPLGLWTRFEVIAKGDTLQYLVNGIKVNEAFEVKPSQGRILLQVEAAEMWVRRFELYPLGQFKEKWESHNGSFKTKLDTIPAYANRAQLMELSTSQLPKGQIKYKLPVGFEMIIAATSPMVANPTMGCVDDRGRLFVGDSVGVNWSAKRFEAELPNRVLMLEDRDSDGVFERSTVFADKLAVPKGGCWADGSLFVASPPGIWKFTDADDDGFAEKRELVVGGFQWTANGADCHGPRLHPDGRLYWTHGRKGHRVQQKDGTLVHEGLNSGVWSMKTDGTDIRWHSLGCADNPASIDFTPTGEIVGTVDLYFGSPRVDTLMQWQLGGVYERPDYLKIIANLPRTHERMPILKELGHVVPSGCSFWKNANEITPVDRPLSPDSSILHFLVAYYNSQKVVRFEFKPAGSTYEVSEHEFLTIGRKGAHLSDVIEAPDGSLLIVDTGTWYSHCPSSLKDNENVPGAIYRIRRTPEGSSAHQMVAKAHRPFVPKTLQSVAVHLATLKSTDEAAVRRSLEELTFREESSTAITAALRELLARDADKVLEHAILTASMRLANFTAADLVSTKGHLAQGRLLRILSQTRMKEGDYRDVLQFALSKLDSKEASLAHSAYFTLAREHDIDKLVTPFLQTWLAQPAPTSEQVVALEKFATSFAGKSGISDVIARMLKHDKVSVQQAALRAIATQSAKVSAKEWIGPLEVLLSRGDSPLLLDALAQVKDSRFTSKLQEIALNETKSKSLRLKALLASSSEGNLLSTAAFHLLLELLTDPANPGFRMEAASKLAVSNLTDEQWDAYLDVLPNAGPLEQNELLVALAVPSKYKSISEKQGRKIASALAKSPMLGTFRQDLITKAFGFLPREVFQVLEPALQAALSEIEAKKERMSAIADDARRGNPLAGQVIYESGKGACIACHKVGSIGKEIGPNLSKIGGIRDERELVESILFPSYNIARDYDLNSFQLSDGSNVLGLIQARSNDGITIKEASGQSRFLANDSIAATTQLVTSLMPSGLDRMLTEMELVDLVAYLRSLK